MVIKRSIPLYNQEIEIVISDEVEALSEAKSSGRASIAILDKMDIPIELTQYAVTAIEDMDEAFLQKVAYRFAGLPMPIAEDEEILIRELGKEDFIALQQEYRDLTMEEEKNLGKDDRIFRDKASYESYIAYQYAFFDFGIWGIFDKDSGALLGKLGFSVTDESMTFGYHIFPKYRRHSYAYRASRRVLEYMLERGYIDTKVCLYIRKENIPSLRLARNLQEEYGDILTVLER